jgi:hypothetical protein
MSLKSILAISLGICFFIFGNIFLFGLVNSTQFSIAYFIFIVICFVIIIYLTRKLFENILHMFVFFLIFVLISASIAFAASTLNVLNDDVLLIESAKLSLNEEISLASQNNDYYLTYADYYTKIIAQYQNSSAQLEKDIVQTKLDIVNSARPATVVLPVTPIVIPEPVVEEIVYPEDVVYNDDYEKEEEYDDDD